MARWSIGVLTAAAIFAGLMVTLDCAGKKRKVSIQPGEQVSAAEVDVKTGLVTSEREGVAVKVQAAILPAPGRDEPHPVFWVTVRNNRRSKIIVKPASTRLIDTFGNQHKPLPMGVGEGSDRIYSYVPVDPAVHFFVSMNYGWPYYPFYPHYRWHRYGPFARSRYRYYDPFWDFGVHSHYRPYWVRRVETVGGGPRLEKEETIYQGARLTFAVVFPQLAELVREVRLIVPEIGLYDEGEKTGSLDFELIFDQIVEVKE